MTAPFPPSCRTCRGEGAVDGDHGDEVCLSCGGTGEQRPTTRVGVIGALCIGAAVLGGFIPSGWYLG